MGSSIPQGHWPPDSFDLLVLEVFVLPYGTVKAGEKACPGLCLRKEGERESVQGVAF